ncbi:putative lysine-specific demethylase JMJ14 [Acorus gramineus]|uniref:Lysine-specific demethylase JMJ14 n=1 Tax=Acorus gramineus TaxID=55184 RepID=A0AAV9AP14_ACOGR|nr:putative lysine-specific demethylase JMJ14 [Acorus gramineus]
MGKGRPRSIEKGPTPSPTTPTFPRTVPDAPVYHPTEEEFKNPLHFIQSIRHEAEPFGICRIVPPKSWSPPFALNRDTFTFPTKSQDIHRLQSRAAPCDPETFELDYASFLSEHLNRKGKRRPVVFEGEELNLCRLFNTVKRFGGYEKACKDKKWGDVFRFVRSVKPSECAKHVLRQLYLEHLLDYEEHRNELDRGIKRKPARPRKSAESGGPSDQICEQCKSGLHGEVMLLCDRCDKGWHLYCLSPPLERVPPGNWYCFECLNSDEDSFGFVPGKKYSIEAFRRLDERAKRRWFGGKPTRTQVEKRFWEIVEGSAGEVEVMYGSDLDTSVCGSGFPRSGDLVPSTVDPEVWREYASSSWNLNNLPKLEGSMLRAVMDNIKGVMVPWLYVGMLFSSFCWHFEDHCFYSMNYLHWGDPKCWYSVPGSEAVAFEQSQLFGRRIGGAKVMRRTLPDLFDAQPDLLFQLVTMLNPSVLQENGVPVYGVLQEPGNFVITFPRSYHGGLNCAEAVNFAPADWLPHGGVAAELYRLYRKAAVLSHEELLCVVAKSACDTKAMMYLKLEMHRLLDKEKTCREQLWRNGIVKSSPMSPRKHPEYVGTEDDPSCIICQQYLYLSAVECKCRPSVFVCVEHFKHLCECKPKKQRLLYRHTLAQLSDLARMDSLGSALTCTLEETSQSGICSRDLSCSSISTALVKKIPYSRASYVRALKEAEQFLWAGHEMDQGFAEDARKLSSEIRRALSSCPRVTIGELEKLHSRAQDYPIHLQESEGLAKEISSVKVWLESVKECISDKRPGSIEVDVLCKLKLGMMELCVQLPEMEILLDLVREVELWQARCSEFFKGPINMKELEVFLQDVDNLTFSIPELKLLRQYHCDALSWSARVHDVIISINDREDHENIVQELTCLFREGESLRVQGYLLETVDELPLLESELKKSSCRQKAMKVLSVKMPLEFIQQLVIDAALLQLGNERLFLKISETLTAVEYWEEKAKFILEHAGQMSEFEELIRISECMFAVLPSLPAVKDSLLVAQSWIRRSQPFLVSTVCAGSTSGPLLKVDDLKELIIESKLLKVSLKAPETLGCILNDVEEWQHNARSLLADFESLFDLDNSISRIDDGLSSVIEQLLCKIASCRQSGLCLGFDLDEMQQLQDASSQMQWILKAISFCSRVPLLTEVDGLIKDVEQLPVTSERSLHGAVFDGVRWLREALTVILQPRTCTWKLEDAEKMLEEVEICRVSFLEVVSELLNAIEKHRAWIQQVHAFFKSESEEQSWSLLVELKEYGESAAFKCPELEKVVSEVEKVEKWSLQCQSVIQPLFQSVNPQRDILLKIIHSMDRALRIFCNLKGCRARSFCMCCPNNFEDEATFTCLTCEDRYHLSCMGPPLATAGMANEYACPFCLCVECGATSKFGGRPLVCKGKRPELEVIIELKHAAKHFYTGIEEIAFVQELVDRAMECKSYLNKIVNSSLAHYEKDLSSISESLLIALKAVAVAGVYDSQACTNLQLALTRHAWKIRAKKLLNDSRKPFIQKVQRILKEGLAINMPPEDHYMQELMKARDISLQWADHAKKVAADSGALELDEVFKLIAEGEKLPIHFEKELKLLRARSELYCICRKPYDQRAMVACDQCDEWYHFDCINLHEPPPKSFFCPACRPLTGEFVYLPPSHQHDDRYIDWGIIK